MIEMDAETVAREVPEGFRDLLDDATLVCVPLSAGGRWSGVILADRRPRRPLTEEERDLLWTLGKTSALAEAARHATFQQARARQLQERIDLAREVHEGVIQRLFGVLLVVSSDSPLPPEARERVTVELQAGAARPAPGAAAAARALGAARRARRSSRRSRGCATRIPTSAIVLTAGQRGRRRAARARAARAVRAGRGGAQRAQARASRRGSR